jgi:hypothetical protein
VRQLIKQTSKHEELKKKKLQTKREANESHVLDLFSFNKNCQCLEMQFRPFNFIQHLLDVLIGQGIVLGKFTRKLILNNI